MSFKPTKGRTVSLQLSGLPDFSGFRQAAKAYEEMGQLAYNIGLDDRRRKYNNAIIQAEADGKTAGVTYDEKNNLVPLTNLNYGEAANFFSKGEREGVLRAYRESAIKTYVAHATNDIEAAADAEFIKNPSNPEEIRSAGAGYISGLAEDLPEEVRLALSPKVDAAFKTAASKASANQRKNQIDYAVEVNTKAFNTNANQLGVLLAKGPPSENAEGYNKRVEELFAESEQYLETIALETGDEASIDAMRDQRDNAIALRMGQAHVERVYSSNPERGLSAALIAIEELIEASTDSDANLDALSKSLQQTAFGLERLKRAGLAEDSRIKEALYQNVVQRTLLGGESVADLIANNDPDVLGMNPSQLIGLLLQDKSFKDQQAAEIINPARTLIANWPNALKTGDPKALDDIYNAYMTIKENRELINDAQWWETQSHYLSYFDATVRGPKRAVAKATLLRELDPTTSSFNMTPQYYAEMIPYMTESNLISPDQRTVGRAFSSESAARTAISKYKTAYDKHHAEIGEFQKGMQTVVLGGVPTKSQKELIEKNYYTEFSVINGVTQPINLMSDNESVLASSIDAVAGFSVRTNGLIPDEALQIINQAKFSPELADRASRIFGQVINAQVANDNRPRYAVMFDVMDKNNIKEEDRAFIQLATDLTPQAAVEITKNPPDYQRGLSLVLGNKFNADEDIGLASDKFMEETMRDMLTMQTPPGFASPTLMFLADYMGMKSMPDNQKFLIQEFARNNNLSISDVNDIVINNEPIKQALKDLFFSRLIAHRGYADPEQVMLGVFMTLGNRYGFEPNEASGQIEMVKSPILGEAQKTVPLDKPDDPNASPVVSLSQKMIEDNVIEAVLSVPAASTTEFGKAINDVRSGDAVMRFFANDDFGGPQTYTVMVFDKFRVPYVISDNYRYDFNNSVQNESYLKAKELVTTSRVKRILDLGGLMDKQLLQSSFEAYEESRGDARSFDGIVRFLNQMQYQFGDSDFLRGKEMTPFTTEEIKDLLKLKETIFRFGFG